MILVSLLTLCGWSCATPPAGAPNDPREIGAEHAASGAPESTATEERESEAKAAADRALRALFPEIQGEITRDSIARALAAERAHAAANASSNAPSNSTASASPINPRRADGHDRRAEPHDRRAEARAAIERGDFEGARALLGEMLVDQELARGRELLARGDAPGALAIFDRAVEIAPHDATARCLRGEAGARAGTELSDRVLIETALADYLFIAREQDDAEAWSGASQTARLLGQTDAALEYARNGMRASKKRASDAPLAVPPEHTLAQAAFDAYSMVHRSGGGDVLPPSAESTRAAELFVECKSALEASIARTPTDAWAWRLLSALYESEGSDAEARATTLSGLNAAPSDEELHQRFARLSASAGGRPAVLAAYAEFKAKHPNVALAEWYPAVARFDTAVEALLAPGSNPSDSSHASGVNGASGAHSTSGAPSANGASASLADARASFAEAEKGFARCRALDPKYDEACRAYEVLCRAGTGWCAYHAGDLAASQKAFLSMEDVKPGGLAAALDDKLASGILGLHWLGSAYAARAQSENSLASLENLEHAGKIYDFLHEYEPENPNWANDSGFFNRDTAVALERKAQGLADQGQIDEANRLLDRAREVMDKSYRAYVDASRLAPDDVRIQNDTGLILTYYLQRDLDRAQAYLKRAQELGEKQGPEIEKQLARPGISSAERDDLKKRLEFVESALGDAYQNLGVLALTLNGDAKSARAWFQKSLTTGQDAREEISGKGGYLEQCDEALAGRLNPLVTDKTRWGAPKSKKSDKSSK